MAKYVNLEDAITELRKSHSIGEAHRRLLQMETINIVQCQDCKKNPKDSMVLEGRRKVSDLLSRCKLFNKLATAQTLADAFAIIQGMETEDAEYVKYGYWKIVEDWDGDEHYECSVCGAEFVLIDGSPEDNDYLFCPHCGAKTDRGESEENVGDDTMR